LNQAQTSAWLEGVSGEFRDRSISLSQGATLLGRSRECQVQLRERRISRRHALIRYAQGRYFLQDQGSPLGTQVNGQAIRAVALNDGDIITIGDATFRFRQSTAASPVAPAAQPPYAPAQPQDSVAAPRLDSAPVTPQPAFGLQQAEEKKRPIAITVICILGFLGVALSIPLIVSDIAGMVGPWYPPYLALGVVVGLACMVGLWMMKKWAVIAYTMMIVINQVVMLAMGVWNVMAIIIPGIVIAIGFSYFSRMD
jgi:hypothetical protein